MAEPSYLKLLSDGELRQRRDIALDLLQSCRLCPRECGVNRLKGETGFCRTGRNARVASHNPHFGEEAPLVGRYGSGTIFVSSCNLLCSFCQNYDISHRNEGFEVQPEVMAGMMLQLAEQGCHNINFVTPTHVVPQILEALVIAAENGLRIPLVYNSGGYERKETLQILERVFDIYMPDFKFWEKKWAEKYCQAADYRERAMIAVKEMHRQVGDLVIDAQGVAVKGLLVRHLVMPNSLSSTESVAAFLAREVSPETYVNIMDQYRPCGDAHGDDLADRRLTSQEFRDALQAARKSGLKRLDQRTGIRFIFR